MKNTHSYPKIEGKYVNLREAEVEDSAFILELRTDPNKEKFINKTDPDLDKQIKYMQHYKTLDNEWYFIIEDKNCNPIGVICIYPYPELRVNWKDSANNPILGTGRWLMKRGISPMESIEGDYLIKLYAYETLHLSFIPMYIHENNTTVLSFQKKWGAKIVGWDEKLKHHLLELSHEDFKTNKKYFDRILYGIKN